MIWRGATTAEESHRDHLFALSLAVVGTFLVERVIDEKAETNDADDQESYDASSEEHCRAIRDGVFDGEGAHIGKIFPDLGLFSWRSRLCIVAGDVEFGFRVTWGPDLLHGGGGVAEHEEFTGVSGGVVGLFGGTFAVSATLSVHDEAPYLRREKEATGELPSRNETLEKHRRVMSLFLEQR